MDIFQSQSSDDEAGGSLQRSILGLLSTELWTLILEEVSFISPHFSNLRLVCRRFNDILIPLLYHKAKGQLSRWLACRDSQVKANIHANVRWVVIDRELDWDEVSKFILESMCLQDLEFSYDKAQFGSMPYQIQNILRFKKPHIRVHISQQRILGQPPQILQVDSFPPPNLSSIRLTEFWDDVRGLQDLLASSIQLQTLDLCRSVRFMTGLRRLPPIKDLTLRAWPYEKNQVPEIWNFTQVKRLKLVEMPMQNFLDSLQPQSFANVTKLEYENTRCVSLLCRLVVDINHLEELDVICLAPTELIPALERHGDTLRILRLRDLSGRRPQMDERRIKEIARLCPNLNSLELDLEFSVRAQHVEDLRLEILASFTMLRKLTIVSQRDASDQLNNRKFAEFLKDYVLRRKCGVPLEELVLVVHGRPNPNARMPPQPNQRIFSWDYSGKEFFREFRASERR